LTSTGSLTRLTLTLATIRALTTLATRRLTLTGTRATRAATVLFHPRPHFGAELGLGFIALLAQIVDLSLLLSVDADLVQSSIFGLSHHGLPLFATASFLTGAGSLLALTLALASLTARASLLGEHRARQGHDGGQHGQRGENALHGFTSSLRLPYGSSNRDAGIWWGFSNPLLPRQKSPGLNLNADYSLTLHMLSVAER
jgi:hypothetical protein